VGVPSSVNPKWLKEIKKYQTDEFDCEKLGGKDEKSIKIAFNPKTKKCDPNMRDRIPHKPVYKIPIKKLYFNAHSARLGQFADTAVGLNQDQLMNKKIIKNELISVRKEFLKKLKREGQQVPGIALADGVLVDGNRRMAFLMEAGFDDMYVVFLPKDIAKDEAAKIEAYYSNQTDGKLEYDKLRQGKQWRDWKKEHGDVDELVDIFTDITKEKIEQRIRAYELAESYARISKWKLGKSAITDVDRINDKTKDGPGFDIFEKRIETSLPKGGKVGSIAEKTRSKFAVAAFCLMKGWIEEGKKNPGQGGIDRPIDAWKKVLKSATTKKEFLDNCKLFKRGGIAKWNQKSMYESVSEMVWTKSVTSGSGSSGSDASLRAIKAALNNLEKVKKGQLKKSDTDTQTRLKSIQTLAKEYLERWKNNP